MSFFNKRKYVSRILWLLNLHFNFHWRWKVEFSFLKTQWTTHQQWMCFSQTCSFHQVQVYAPWCVFKPMDVCVPHKLSLAGYRSHRKQKQPQISRQVFRSSEDSLQMPLPISTIVDCHIRLWLCHISKQWHMYAQVEYTVHETMKLIPSQKRTQMCSSATGWVLMSWFYEFK